MYELRRIANVSDGIFELEIFIVKDPASRSALSAGKGLQVMMSPCMCVMRVEGGAAWVWYGVYKVHLAKLL